MPISEQHRYIIDDLIFAKKCILQQKPVNAIQAIDRAFNELADIETTLEHKRIKQEEEQKQTVCQNIVWSKSIAID